jgi:hypothetical protein
MPPALDGVWAVGYNALIGTNEGLLESEEPTGSL